MLPVYFEYLQKHIQKQIKRKNEKAKKKVEFSTNTCVLVKEKF